jgi:competence protein ComGC
MALAGTLKDFGIADILQLIGQQQKTGTLHLSSKDQEVSIGFQDGNIVRAESATRNKKELIGEMLVRAEIITPSQLETALDAQRRSLKRLGDVLVSLKMITPLRFKQMVQLQATETLYKLFTWKSGKYEFEQVPVDVDKDAGIAPIRAESVLMEGFRMVDEWPVIKRVINRYDLTFEKTRELPMPAGGKDAFDTALDSAFGDAPRGDDGEPSGAGEFKSIGASERKVHALATPGRDLRKLVDLACLGEFETCKALLTLVNNDYLRSVPPAGRALEIGPSVGAVDKVMGAAGRVVVTMLVLGALLFVLSRVDLDQLSVASSPSQSYADPAAQRFIARAQMSRIQAAIQVYELEQGEAPAKLDALVDAGLLGREDLHYPWRDAYYYRRVAPREFILLPPLR